MNTDQEQLITRTQTHYTNPRTEGNKFNCRSLYL